MHQQFPAEMSAAATITSPGRGLRPPRILHVISALNTGGAEIMLLRLLSVTHSEFSHSVISLKKEGTVGSRLKELGVPVEAIGLQLSAPNPSRVFAIRDIARDLQPDLVQGWMYHGNLMASFAASGLAHHPPVVWGIHQSLDGLSAIKWQTRAVVHLGARLSRNAAKIIYVSRTARLQHEKSGYHEANSLIIPNGVDCKTFRPDPAARQAVHAEFGLSDQKLLVGLSARYDPLKNHEGFLRAAAIVAARYSDIHFVLFGANVNVKQSLLRRTLSELDIESRVSLLDERQDVPRLLAAIDIACSASLAEAFSLSIAEAMASALPCVVTDVGDSAFMVGDTGVVVAPGNPHLLAEAMIRLIEAGPERRSQLGAAARRRVETEFSVSEIARRYESVYRDCLVQRPAK